MPTDREALLRIAEAIVDRTPVDWRKESAARRDLERELRCLELIEDVAAAHRELQFEVSGTDDPTTVATASVRRAAMPKRWGPLEIVEQIGSGGFGDVYRAHDPKLARDVALKLWRTDLPWRDRGEEQFLNEARRLAQLRHPKILTVHGAGRHDGRVGMWADLLEGQNLEDCLREQGPFGAEEATLIGIEVCSALAAVHGAGLVHRDVKTANIMRERGGRIVLLDFSSVTHQMPSATDPDGARFSGTPAFMAPELFGRRDSGTRADIYSLGVVLYRLVSGRFPVEAENLLELREKHERRESTPLRDARPDLPAEFVRVVDRALAFDPEERYATVGEMERALSASGAGDAPPALWRTSSRWKAPATVAASLAVLAVIAWLLWPPPFRVDAELCRMGEGVKECLLDGGRIRTGDSLFLEIESTRSMHVYVLDEDEQGTTFVLFPLAGLDLTNPLSANVAHRLPGPVDGEPNYWDVTSAGGTETILVVASRRPLSNVEERLAALPQAGSSTPQELGDSALGVQLRGIGGLSARPPSERDGGSRLSEIAGEVSVRAGSSAGVRIWEIRLSNP